MLEDSSSGIVKYVYLTMICFLCRVIQHSFTNAKDGLILLSGVKKLPFIQAGEGETCSLSGLNYCYYLNMFFIYAARHLINAFLITKLR